MGEWLQQFKVEKGKGIKWDLFYLILAIGGVLLAQLLGNYVLMEVLARKSELFEYPPLLVSFYFIINAALLILIVYLCVKWIEKKGFASLGLTFNDESIKAYVKGALTGTIMLVIVVAIIVLGGGLSFEKRGINTSQALPFGLMIIAWMIQGASEEILIRGYLLIRIGIRRGFVTGIMISSLCFGLLHLFNNGSSLMAILNVSLTGVFLALYTLRKGSLWSVCGWHMAWNFVQGNILGLNVSGSPISVVGEIFRGNVESHNTLLTGGEFGIEASLATTLIMLAAIIYNLFWYTENQSEEKDI